MCSQGDLILAISEGATRDGDRLHRFDLLASARIPLSLWGVNILPTEASPVGCVGRASNRPASRLGLLPADRGEPSWPR